MTAGLRIRPRPKASSADALLLFVGCPGRRYQFARFDASRMHASVIGSQMAPLASPDVAPQTRPSEVFRVVSAAIYRSSTVVQTADAPSDAAPTELRLGGRVAAVAGPRRV